MSTRCRIGILNEDKSVTSVYCHSDGYPDGVGSVLNEYYTSEEEVRELISYGDMSYIGTSIGIPHNFTDQYDDSQCCFYGRDRGEENVESVTHEFRQSDWPQSDQEFLFLFDNLQWKYVDCYANDDWDFLIKAFVLKNAD